MHSRSLDKKLLELVFSTLQYERNEKRTTRRMRYNFDYRKTEYSGAYIFILIRKLYVILDKEN